MIRKIVSATVSAALCLMPVGPALAQSYNQTDLGAARGAQAGVNLRIPLGTVKKAEPTVGLTFSFNRTVGADYDGRARNREVRVADIRFGTDGHLRQAKVASFDLANLDRDKRMNLTGEGNTLWIVVGLVAAGVAICLLADCFDGDDENSSSDD